MVFTYRGTHCNHKNIWIWLFSKLRKKHIKPRPLIKIIVMNILLIVKWFSQENILFNRTCQLQIHRGKFLLRNTFCNPFSITFSPDQPTFLIISLTWKYLQHRFFFLMSIGMLKENLWYNNHKISQWRKYLKNYVSFFEVNIGNLFSLLYSFKSRNKFNIKRYTYKYLIALFLQNTANDWSNVRIKRCKEILTSQLHTQCALKHVRVKQD